MNTLLILFLLILNTGAIITIAIFLGGMGASLAKLKSDLNHLSEQLTSLAKDFKEHLKSG